MAIITIYLDIKNPKEVIEHNKSSFMAKVADFFLSDEALKEKVTDTAVDEIVSALKDNLTKQLDEKKVEYTLEVMRTDK